MDFEFLLSSKMCAVVCTACTVFQWLLQLNRHYHLGLSLQVIVWCVQTRKTLTMCINRNALDEKRRLMTVNERGKNIYGFYEQFHDLCAQFNLYVYLFFECYRLPKNVYYNVVIDIDINIDFDIVIIIINYIGDKCRRLSQSESNLYD